MSTGYSSQKYIAGAIHNRSHPQQKPSTTEAIHNRSHPQQKPSTTGAIHNRKGHMKRKFSCALKFYFVISNKQTGNMRLKFNIICRVVMLLQLVCSSYGCDVRVYTFIPVQEAFQVDYIADRKVLNSCVYIGVLVAQIRLNGEGIGSAVLGNCEV